MEYHVNARYGIDLDGDVDVERDSDVKLQEDEEEEDAMEEVENEKENEDEDDGKEPQTIGQGEMVSTLAHDADTMVDNQPSGRPEQVQEMHKHMLWPQPPESSQWRHSTLT